jgi:hypothetical protein
MLLYFNLDILTIGIENREQQSLRILDKVFEYYAVLCGPRSAQIFISWKPEGIINVQAMKNLGNKAAITIFASHLFSR